MTDFFDEEIEAFETVRVQILDNYKGPSDLPVQYSTEGSAGFELYAAEDVVLHPGEQAIIGTGIKVALPRNMELQIRPKSGRAAKERLTITNSPGTVDSDYRGEVKVIVANSSPVVTPDELDHVLKMARNGISSHLDNSKRDIWIRAGEKLAQGVFAWYVRPNVKVVASLDETVRGEGGLGSTGL